MYWKCRIIEWIQTIQVYSFPCITTTCSFFTKSSNSVRRISGLAVVKKEVTWSSKVQISLFLSNLIYRGPCHQAAEGRAVQDQPFIKSIKLTELEPNVKRAKKRRKTLPCNSCWWGSGQLFNFCFFSFLSFLSLFCSNSCCFQSLNSQLFCSCSSPNTSVRASVLSQWQPLQHYFWYNFQSTVDRGLFISHKIVNESTYTWEDEFFILKFFACRNLYPTL